MNWYQQMGHVLFPIYCLLLSLAYLLNWRDRDQRLLTLLYWLGPIAAFQLFMDGKAPSLGFHWYELVAFVQVCVLLVAQLSEVRAAKTIMMTACFAVALNAAYYTFFRLGLPLPRQGFFLGMVSIQLFQIGSLITCSPPLWPFLSRAFRRTQRREPWQTRVAIKP